MADLPGLPGRAGASTRGAGIGSPARSALLRQRWTLPDLRCLHIIGYGERALEIKGRDSEGAGRQTRGPNNPGGVNARSRRLAMERAADALTLLLGTLTLPALCVLSLDVALLRPLPHALAGLRHLALRMANDAPGGERDKRSGLLIQSPAMFEAVAGSLPALQTLYAEAASFCIIDYAHVIDLMPCKHLRAFTLVNVYAKAIVTVPEGCCWTVVLPADSGDLDWFSPTTWPGVAACHMRGFRNAGVSMARGSPCAALPRLSCDVSVVALPVLAELRIVLDAASFPRGSEDYELRLRLDGGRLPALQLLEVDVPCALQLRVHAALEMRSLVVLAHSLAAFVWEPSVSPWCELNVRSGIRVISERARAHSAKVKRVHCPASHPWEAIFVRIATTPPDGVRRALRDLFTKSYHPRGASSGAACTEHAGSAWRGAAPADVCLSDLRACSCRTCLDCLSRARVPLAAAQAWRRAGFDRLLAPLCR